MSDTIETFNPAHLNRSDTLSSVVTVGKPVATASKTTKFSNSLQRLEFEPLYTDLKVLIGHNWGIYHDALVRFIRGKKPNCNSVSILQAALDPNHWPASQASSPTTSLATSQTISF